MASGPAMMIVPLSDHGREDEDEHEEMRQSCVVACGRTPHAVVQASIYRLSAWRPTTLSGASRWQRRAGLAACCRGARYGPVWCVADLEHLPGREEYYYGGKYTYRSYNVPRSYGTVK
jgi:hypothetical protein